ncbi:MULTISPECIES: hypothetical protein [Brachybacterium]|uniref:hypothetical protein n=1 Tax=Brachybacterium TaxID=43668 RepID=UPI0021A573C1|nr:MULTISPECIES: hypothetical protein [Brachybacterium]MCT1910849.1 hypothetical protein [Brachybacterium paraconglomeratum]
MTAAESNAYISGAGVGGGIRGWGGGGGSSYIGTAVAGSTTALAGNGSAVEGQRNAGLITITY